jgi:hypothetical protein
MRYALIKLAPRATRVQMKQATITTLELLGCLWIGAMTLLAVVS